MVKGEYVQVYIRKNSVITTRCGPFTGMSFAGHPNFKPIPTVRYKMELIVNQNEMYYMYTFDSPRFLKKMRYKYANFSMIWLLKVHKHTFVIKHHQSFCRKHSLVKGERSTTRPVCRPEVGAYSKCQEPISPPSLFCHYELSLKRSRKLHPNVDVSIDRKPVRVMPVIPHLLKQKTVELTEHVTTCK
ncbi:S-locus glycoprotein domain-containing protein [Artemisia annua]|uniref:S-locus glycoprotein domain-containing protein n=1 Tax=Artemisia annua TaxID=35608 RepID=A0A2U1LEX2_ARTAN|nr:S-locus glycoprotein domain-containing protein [Artemisia annua]